ncbi:MAG: VIT and VWA domain-containing protein [Gemmatimonadetes bacterium]|nr:VIT and VWA domain-containing protein [Gemmatimonadota bacterium]
MSTVDDAPSNRSADSTARRLPAPVGPATRSRSAGVGAMRASALAGHFALICTLGVATPAAAQGWIEPLPGRSALGGWQVERTLSRVTVTVEGRVARVEVSERFRNRGRSVAEGSYLYPLPGEAAFASFSLFQGETELRGEVMDRERAREIYEEIVRRRADPALIELAGQGLLRARVFPIEPGEEREVTLRYEQLLSRAGDALHFQYSGGVREEGRIFPAGVPVEGRPRGGRLGDDGRRGADSERGDAPTDVELVVEDAARFLEPFSPTHALDSDRERGAGGHERLVVRPRGGVTGHLSVFLPLARDGIGITLAMHAPPGEDRGYFMLTLSPGETDAPARPRDLTVVVDVSGSMSGRKMEQARSALMGLLETLEPDDRFRLVAFSGAVRPESDGWRSADEGGLREAMAWVQGLRADGGTNIEGALEEAFRLEPGLDRLPVVIFLTDGLPTVGEQDPEAIADRAERLRRDARIFAFGVGDDVNTHLLDRLSAATRGTTDYVRQDESVERALSLLSARIRHPVLTDLEWDGAPVRLAEVHPVEIPDVFAGQELVLFGRYEGAGEGELGLTGRRAGRAERFSVEADFPRRTGANAFIPRLWASRKLGHLTRQLWIEGSSEALVEEIRRTALRYGLPSEFTAYLVQEPEALADADAAGLGGRRMSLDRLVMTAAPSSPAQASGAGAVRAAAEAQRMRSVRDEADMAEAEAKLAAAAPADARAVAGRLFRRSDGVWTEVGIPDDLPVVAVRRFSRAWFDLLEALPELAAPSTRLEKVVVRGRALAVHLGDEGEETLDSVAIRRIVDGFRDPVTP